MPIPGVSRKPDYSTRYVTWHAEDPHSALVWSVAAPIPLPLILKYCLLTVPSAVRYGVLYHAVILSGEDEEAASRKVFQARKVAFSEISIRTSEN